MGLETILSYFPLRIGKALTSYGDWDGITEIRLRKDLPLSLTHFSGNVFLNEKGEAVSASKGISATQKEIRAFICSFCRGNVYRYFDTMQEGFLVNEEGFRLGLCPEKRQSASYLPENFEGVNLRIPRFVHGAADDFLSFFRTSPLASTLILSPPGVGKTTLLRDLAAALSLGREDQSPLRVAVIDERRELFPSAFQSRCGACDVLTGYKKAEGMEIATRLLSPQVILCDEIGGKEDAAAILESSHNGCIFFASAHGKCLDDAKRRPFLSELIQNGVFTYAAQLERLFSSRFQSRISFQKIL